MPAIKPIYHTHDEMQIELMEQLSELRSNLLLAPLTE